MATGIILAGGESRRANTNKMLLEIYDKPLILHTIENMSPFVEKIIVVTGKYHEELKPLLKDVEVVYNADYQKGMFSSVQAGVKHAERNFFIIPGDCPFVKASTFNALMVGSDFLIRVPMYKEKTGHPTYFSEKMKDKILSAPADSNLRVLRDEVGFKTVEVNDPNILNDIDTINDYQQMINKLERN